MVKKSVEEEPVEEITAIELKNLFDEKADFQVVDIRQPHELVIGKLPNTKAIPLGQIVRRQSELDPALDTIVVCKVGVRSVLAIRALRDSGYTGRLFNLKDGMNSWAQHVDQSIAKY